MQLSPSFFSLDVYIQTGQVVLGVFIGRCGGAIETVEAGIDSWSQVEYNEALVNVLIHLNHPEKAGSDFPSPPIKLTSRNQVRVPESARIIGWVLSWKTALLDFPTHSPKVSTGWIKTRGRKARLFAGLAVGN